MGMDPSSNRSSGFWATLGKSYLQLAENTLPKLGQAASDALAMRYGGQAPDTQVTPQADVAQDGQSKMTFWVVVAGIGLLLLFGLAGMFGTKR